MTTWLQEPRRHTPNTAGTFWRKFRKDPRNALKAFPGIAGKPRAIYFKAFEASRAFSDFSPAGASSSRSGSGEGLRAGHGKFPAVPRVFLTQVALDC